MNNLVSIDSFKEETERDTGRRKKTEGGGDSHHLGDVLVHLPEALQDSGHEVDSRVAGRRGRRGVQVLR